MWFWLLIALLLLADIAFMLRNTQVYCYRRRMLDQIRAKAQADIEARRSWVWRYLIFDEISYLRMVLYIWKPLKRFGIEQALDEMSGDARA